MAPLLALTQLALLLAYALQDAATRRLGNLPILVLLLAGALAALVDGPAWNGWNLILPAAALVAYRYRQIGGADAKVLIALLPMPGLWVPWFLLGAFLAAVGLHVSTKRPPLLVAYATSYAVLGLWTSLGGRFA